MESHSACVLANFLIAFVCGTCFAISDVGLQLLQGNMRVCLHMLLFCLKDVGLWILRKGDDVSWALQCRRMTSPPGIQISVTARL